MAERKGKGKARSAESAAPVARIDDVDESERQLGRYVSLGLPVACIGGAIVVGMMAGVGSALLIVAAGALLGTIALLWASVRTLSGDAPLSVELEAIAAQRHGVDALGEQKRRVLRALKDLEAEHAIGKIDDGDYDEFVARYREEAKTVMRKMDLRVAPLREEAERVAREYLTKRGLAPGGAKASKAVAEEPEPAGENAGEDVAAPAKTAATGRRACATCSTSNEADATFCKKCGSPLATGKNDADA